MVKNAFLAVYLRAMDSVRQNKVNSLLQQEMAEVMQGHNHALLPGGLITVTAVRVSPDLGELGHRVGKQLRIVPELLFYIDDSLDRIEEIDNLLKK